MNENSCVILTDGKNRVSIAPAGPPGLGLPVRIEIMAPPFLVTVEAEARDFVSFRQQVARLHDTLIGEACLGFWGEDHAITLSGNGRGKIGAKIEVSDGLHPKRAWLTVLMNFDQSYLPEIISSIELMLLKT